MEINGNQKSVPFFSCKKCRFSCMRKSDWERHSMTSKHKMETKKRASAHYCECGKEYLSSSGFWKHKQKCPNFQSVDFVDKEWMKMLMKENTEMKHIILEVIKQGTGNTTHNNITTTTTTNNSNNKTFNLQFFLNEECKDSLNITDFVNLIQLQIQDLEETSYLGYVDGISKVVIHNLKKLDTNKRPIHCSDLKREVLYIKEDDKWIRENENKDNMVNMIKKVANKNIRNIPEWVKMHPDCLDVNSHQNDKYLNIVSNAMSGVTEKEQKTNMHKIISNVAKVVTIGKDRVS